VNSLRDARMTAVEMENAPENTVKG
jgi:hypothetical protein